MTIQVPDDLAHSLEEIAAAEKKSVEQLAVERLRSRLDKPTSPEAAPTIRRELGFDKVTTGFNWPRSTGPTRCSRLPVAGSGDGACALAALVGTAEFYRETPHGFVMLTLVTAN